MINRDDIEAGDKVYTRDGGCLVAREGRNGVGLSTQTILGIQPLSEWGADGRWLNNIDFPLDIIRIEKAPKPVVYEAFVGMNHDGGCSASSTFNAVRGCARVVKITLVNGVYDKDRSEQVK